MGFRLRFSVWRNWIERVLGGSFIPFLLNFSTSLAMDMGFAREGSRRCANFTNSLEARLLYLYLAHCLPQPLLTTSNYPYLKLLIQTVSAQSVQFV
ncbi:hypothetical protein BKA61DRAFT_603303, partial [Leptodontidium sp. MPI-SDFR-AT-0119]